MHGGVERRLHADHLDVRLDRLGRRRDARHDAAAADRHHDDVEVGRIGHQLETDRALARHDPGVVIRVHEGEILAPGEVAREHRRRVDGIALDHDSRSEAARALDLVEGRALRHHDDGGNPEPLGEAGHALRVVAGRHGDDAVLGLCGRQALQLVEGAAILERAGILQVLQLQHDRRGAGRLGQARRRHGRRAHHLPGDGRGGGADVLDGHGHGRGPC
jgi:hypothetical protein